MRINKKTILDAEVFEALLNKAMAPLGKRFSGVDEGRGWQQHDHTTLGLVNNAIFTIVNHYIRQEKLGTLSSIPDRDFLLWECNDFLEKQPKEISDPWKRVYDRLMCIDGGVNSTGMEFPSYKIRKEFNLFARTLDMQIQMYNQTSTPPQSPDPLATCQHGDTEPNFNFPEQGTPRYTKAVRNFIPYHYKQFGASVRPVQK